MFFSSLDTITHWFSMLTFCSWALEDRWNITSLNITRNTSYLKNKKV